VATYISIQSGTGRIRVQSGTGNVLLQSNSAPRTGGPFTQFRSWTITGMRYGSFAGRGSTPPSKVQRLMFLGVG
jgi:hypothetical protein